MTAPSLVLQRIVATLSERLGAAFSVVAHDGDLGADGKEFVTLRSPGVLVACLGWPSITDDDSNPGAVRAHFVAVCHARLPNQDDDQNTSGQVAMDLAHVVTGIVRLERWADEDGEDTADGAAERIRATNQFTNALAQKGLRVWPVQWLQDVLLEPAVDTASLNRLAAINLKFAVVEEGNPDDDEFADDTHDAEARVEFPEAP